MMGSRFTSPDEQNYSPVDGELQALVYGLHKTRCLTLGCEKLVVGVDNMPSTAIMTGAISIRQSVLCNF